MLIEFAEDMIKGSLVDTWGDGPGIKEIQLVEIICLSSLKIKFN